MSIILNVNLNSVPRCPRCKAYARLDSHHVTYYPEKRVPLCRECHIGITVINIQYGLCYGRLSNTDRRYLYKRFMKHQWRMEHEAYRYKSLTYIRKYPDCLKVLLKTFKL